MRSLERNVLALTAVLALAAVSPALAQTDTLQGDWGLDLKASTNVPEAQKGVDLRIAIKGNQFTMTRLVAGKMVGQVLTLTLDGTPRQLEVAPGQNALVEARWLERGRTMQQVVNMAGQAGLPIKQKTVVELSTDGMVMKRAQEISQAGETTDRMMVYRRKM